MSLHGTEIGFLREEFELHVRAMNASSCGIVVADVRKKDGPIIYANAAFEKITGYSSAETVGRNCRFLQGTGRDEDKAARIRQAIVNGEHLQILLQNFRKDGTPFLNELILSPIFDSEGALTHMIGVQNDVTQREALKADLAKKTEDLVAANEELTTLNTEKTRLLNIAAHDLRGPLGSLKYLLEFAAEAESEEDLIEMVTISADTVDGLVDLVNDLLAVSTMESGKLKIEKRPVDLLGYFGKIEKRCRRITGAKGIAFELEADFAVQSFAFDANRIEQVINNLVGNATKFSERRTKITLAVEADDKTLRIAVRDEGLGIPQKELPEIFGEFARASTQPTEHESSLGLGLSICKQLVELHGGRISVSSEVGKGSTFTVELINAQGA